MPLEGELLYYPLFIEFKENDLPNFKCINLHKDQAVDEPEPVLKLNPEECKRVDVVSNHFPLFLHNKPLVGLAKAH